jgi:hypothetical protein
MSLNSAISSRGHMRLMIKQQGAGATRQSALHVTDGWTTAAPLLEREAAANSPYLPRLSSWASVISMQWQHAQKDRVFIGKMMFQRGCDMQPNRRDQEL